MKREEILKKIKSKGYWEINIRPGKFNAEKIPTQKLKDLVRTSAVELTGWDYPHFTDSNNGEPYAIPNGIEKITDWEYFCELWRMTSSGNFYHVFGSQEDWMGEPKPGSFFSRENNIEGKWMGVLRTLHTIVEIFEFARRMALKENAIFDTVFIRLEFHGLNERQLVVDSRMRASFMFPRVAKTEDPWSFEKTYNLGEFITSAPELAIEPFVELVRLFNWDNPSMPQLKEDVKKFLEGKLD